jgi:hypothetical protein
MNRNRSILGMLAAGLIFVAQARADSVVGVLAKAYELPAVTPDAWQLRFGTYWYVSWGRSLVPMPGEPTGNISKIYSLGEVSDLSFLVDENTPVTSGVNFTRLGADLDWLLGALAQAREAKMAAEHNRLLGLTSETDSYDEESYGSPGWSYSSNELWLQVTGFSLTDGIDLTLHNTRQHYYYQLLSNADLTTTNWIDGEVVLDSAGTNSIAYSPVSVAGIPINLFRAKQVDTVVSIMASTPDAFKPSDTNGTGFVPGLFEIDRSNDKTAEDLTVYFSIGGTATNGVNYIVSVNGGPGTNLLSPVIIPAGLGYASIEIDPKFDGVLDFDKTVTLTLVSSNYYVVDTNKASATVTIHDNLFTVVATNVAAPVGIDYSPTTNALIVSVNLRTSGAPVNFVWLGTNSLNEAVFQGWSGISNLADEVKLVIVQTNGLGQITNSGGFTNGDMFFGSGNAIGWLSADGSRSNLNWCTLTNAAVTNALDLRGSLYVDRTGTWSNQLIAVTSYTAPDANDKGVWRIDSHAHSTLVTNISTPHLEGVITITNDAPRWGPWAGKIITGDESAVPKPLIYSIDTNGAVKSFSLDIHPEDFDIIPTNQDLYCVNFKEDQSKILKISRTVLTKYVGDLLITDAGEIAFPPKLFIIHWDGATTNFVTRSTTLPATIGGTFEHVTFAPINLPSLAP